MRVLMLGLDEFSNNLKKSSPFFIHHKKFTDYVGEIHNLCISKDKNFEFNYYKDSKIHAIRISKILFPIKSFFVGLKLIKKYNIQVIHTQDPILTGLPGFLLSLFTKKRLIVSFYGFIPDDKWINSKWYLKRSKFIKSFLEFLKAVGLSFLSYTLVRIILLRASKVRVLNQVLGDYAIKLGCDPKKVFIIPMRVSLENLQEKKLNKDKFVILNIGQLIPRKGIDYLIKAMPLILKKIPNAWLYIGGYGFEEEYLKKISGENIKFLGSLTSEQVLQQMADANVFVLPTLSEGMGQVLLESLSVKIPVIATNVGGIPTFINEGNGVLIKPYSIKEIADSIIFIKNNPERAKKLVEKGHNMVKEKYNLERVAKLVGELMKSVGYN
ncbi:hypothetical protein CL621_04250 [archaeon]|nr:hypothetical protein [archaeon]|tara:strand:+ start:57 stop:1202 length:1146 start_codon:yes stop_codon:yes gene_type:complete